MASHTAPLETERKDGSESMRGSPWEPMAAGAVANAELRQPSGALKLASGAR